MYNNIQNLPKNIDIEFNVNGSLFMVYMYPTDGYYEIALWEDGIEQVIDGFFDPLDICNQPDYYDDNLWIFDHLKMACLAEDVLMSAATDLGADYSGTDIYLNGLESIDIYGGDYMPIQEEELPSW